MDDDLKLGEKLWFVPGYRRDGLIIVQATILEVDDHFRKKHPDSFVYYWIDEPVGHGLDADELYHDFEDARDDLSIRFETAKRLDEEYTLDAQLDKFRLSVVKFIVSTWPPAQQTQASIDHLMSHYPAKERGKEWFNLKDLGME